MLAQGLDVGWVVFLDGVVEPLQPGFAHAPWYGRCGDQGHHGRDDAIVPVDLVETYAAFATKVGDRATLVVVEGAGHFEPVDARTGAARQVIEAVRDMFTALPA